MTSPEDTHHDIERVNVNQTSEFTSEAQRQLSLLRKDDVYPNGTYRSRLANGNELMISQFTRGQAASHEAVNAEYAIEESVLLAQDSQGKLVGYRLIQLKEPLGNLRAMGYTRVAHHGRGIATALENVNQDYLQRLANTLQQPIVQLVHNSNADDLGRMHEADVSQEALAAKQLEQMRWQTLFGPGGKLGFDEHGRKTFIPTESGPKAPILSREQVQQQLITLFNIINDIWNK